MTASDDHLIMRVRAGHRRALEQLLRRHQGPLRAFAFVVAPVPQLADDIAQETILRAIDALDRYQGPDRVGLWLRGIARNVAREYWRDWSRQTSAFSIDDDGEDLIAFVSGTAESALTAQQEEEIGALRRCLERLGEPGRRLLELRFAVGLSSDAIGETLDRRPGSIRASLSRLYQRLRRCVREQRAGTPV